MAEDEGFDGRVGVKLVRTVRICQNNACRKMGANQVLAAFEANPVEGVTVEASGCFGLCGNGPMVLVLPEQVWYWRVQADEVAAIVDRHLRGGVPVWAMVYGQEGQG